MPVLLVALSGVCCLGAWLVLGMLGSTADNTLQTVGFEMQLCGATVRLLAVLVDVVLLYLSVTLAVTGLVRGGGAGGQPPRPVVIFEYTAGAYALLQLAADAFPRFATPATVISMCALCFGFVQMVRYLIKEKPAGKTAG